MDKGKNNKKPLFFKIPQNKYTLKANIYLAIGFVFVVSGVFLLVASFVEPDKVFTIRAFVALCAGAVLLFFAFAFTESGAFMFTGLVSVIFGVLSLLIDSSLISLTLKELWPILVIGCGVALIPSGLYTQRRIRSIYLFPAIMIICLGVIFLLFSLNVIKESFAGFMAKWWPVAFILGGIAIIAVFLVQQSKYNKIIPYMKDDSLINGDDN